MIKDAICQPPLSEWRTLLTTGNRERGDQSPLPNLQEAIIAEAFRWSSDLALRFGIPAPARPRANTPLLMTGHQPSVYHPGIIEKHRKLDEWLVSGEGVGVNVIIDTDQSSGLGFLIPGRNERGLYLSEHQLATRSGTYQTDTVQSKDSLTTLLDQIRNAFDSALSSGVRRHLEESLQFISRHPGRSVVDVSTALRRHFNPKSAILDVPLSALLLLPEVPLFLGRLLSKPIEFATTYNRVLSEHRAAHTISNRANPFPDLKVQNGRYELPFWINSSATAESRRERIPAWIELKGGMALLGNEQQELLSLPVGQIVTAFTQESPYRLIPRGAIITLLLRLIGPNLFIHGQGGGRYDTFTDRLIREVFLVEPPPFIVVSATSYLYPTEAAAFAQARELQARKREILFHPETALGTGVFTAEDEHRIQDLVTVRTGLVELVQGLPKKDPRRRDAEQQLKRVAGELRVLGSLGTAQFSSVESNLNTEDEPVVCCREFPFFLLDGVEP
jgi:hypothetical protein